jgi:hypothetical protein
MAGVRIRENLAAAHTWFIISTAIVKAQQMAKRCMSSGYKECGQ